MGTLTERIGDEFDGRRGRVTPASCLCEDSGQETSWQDMPVALAARGPQVIGARVLVMMGTARPGAEIPTPSPSPAPDTPPSPNPPPFDPPGRPGGPEHPVPVEPEPGPFNPVPETPHPGTPPAPGGPGPEYTPPGPSTVPDPLPA